MYLCTHSESWALVSNKYNKYNIYDKNETGWKLEHPQLLVSSAFEVRKKFVTTFLVLSVYLLN
jgi:hypothetical protein